MTRAKRPRISAPPDSAAGIPAVVETLRHTFGKAGVGRGMAALRNANRPGGFDCPGCAWPDTPGKRIDFCENGAKAIADEATRRGVGAEFFARYSLAALNERSDRWLNDQGRIVEPLVRRSGDTHYAPIDWHAAYRLIADQLQSLDSPDEAVFYTSGRTSNEAAFLYQLFARRFGTNNLPDSSNLCHESSGVALQESLGSGKGTVRLDDFRVADAIFVIGQNPGSNHPRMLAALEEAKLNGARIVSINPLAESGLKRFRNPQQTAGYLGAGTVLADLHLPIKISGDVALFTGICKSMLDAEAENPGAVLDGDFIEQHTSGFDTFRHATQATTWDTIEVGSGIERGAIERAARIAMESERTIACWAMGVTQHRNAVANVQHIVNFLLMRGNVGRPGSGACPVRGHSNVQGDRTMGITVEPREQFLDALAREFDFSPPRSRGLDAVAAVREMHAGKVKALIALGGNLASASPDSEFTEAAMRRCSLTVQISTKLNRSHLAVGRTALILPALGRTDRDTNGDEPQFVTSENSMGIVAPSVGRLPPLSADMRSEVRIVAEMAAACLRGPDRIDWRTLGADYMRVRGAIARTVPGFDRFNTRLKDEGSLELPHPVRDRREFPNAAGKALFVSHPIPVRDAGDETLLLTTVRSHDQFNTTIYSERDRYRGIDDGRRVLFIHAADIEALGMRPGDAADVMAVDERRVRVMRDVTLVPYRIPRGCVAAYYPEANVLIPIDAVAARSNTPAYKSIEVRVRPAAAG